MLRYAFKFALFLLPLVAAFVLFEAGLRRTLSLYSYKRLTFQKHAHTITVLVTGTSHEEYGIRAGTFGEGFNLAHPSQALGIDAHLIERVLPELPALKVALIGVSDFSFGVTLDPPHPESWRLFYYQRYWNVNGDSYPLPFLDTRRFSLLALFGHSRAIALARAGFPVDPPPGSDDRGFANATAYGADSVTEERAQERINLWTSLYNPAHEAGTSAALVQSIKALKARGVTVALLVSPLSPPYRHVVPPERTARFRKNVAHVVSETGAAVFDYSGDPRFVSEDFTDPDHLNPDGATKYSEVLAREVVAVLRDH